MVVGCSHVDGVLSSSIGALNLEVAMSVGQLGGGVDDERYGTVENRSSKTTWYCGLTSPVFRFKTRATLLACEGERPRYIPVWERGSHLGVPP